MYRGTIVQDTFAPRFELASAFHTAWRLADAPLRAEIEQAIRTYTRRRPAFRAQLRTALACYTHIPQQASDTRTNIASALHAIWQLADAPLRADIEQAIRRYVRQNPERMRDFQRIIAAIDSAKPPSIRRINPIDQ